MKIIKCWDTPEPGRAIPGRVSGDPVGYGMPGIQLLVCSALKADSVGYAENAIKVYKEGVKIAYKINTSSAHHHYSNCRYTSLYHKVRHVIRAIKPEAYTPPYIGLGPYHHWREDLYEMEPYKVLALKACHNDHQVVEKLTQLAESLKQNIA
ncbi:hypothetical protein RDABS01_035286 [Bienertia sinuspersici]